MWWHIKPDSKQSRSVTHFLLFYLFGPVFVRSRHKDEWGRGAPDNVWITPGLKETTNWFSGFFFPPHFRILCNIKWHIHHTSTHLAGSSGIINLHSHCETFPLANANPRPSLPRGAVVQADYSTFNVWTFIPWAHNINTMFVSFFCWYLTS